jgi:hypothetical protein
MNVKWFNIKVLFFKHLDFELDLNLIHLRFITSCGL